MEHLALPTFRKCVQRYSGDYKIKTFSCLDQFLVMAFAQVLIHTARHLYADDPFGIELDQTVYTFDSTTIDLYLYRNEQAPLVSDQQFPAALHRLL